MEDFYYAGGLRAMLSELKDLLNLDCATVNGRTLGENLEAAVAEGATLLRVGTAS